MSRDLHPDEIRLPETDELANEQLVKWGMEFVRDSCRGYSNFRSSLQSRYDLVRGYWDGDTGVVGWNNCPINFLMSMFQSDVAKKKMVIFGERPYAQFIAPQEQMALAKKRSALIEAQFDAGHGKDELDDFWLTQDLYGRGIGRYYWRREYGDHMVREQTFLGTRVASKPCPRTGMSGISVDQPDFYNVDPIDFFAQPGVHKLHNMRMVGEQLFPEWESIVVGSMKGPNGEPPIYDPRVVNEIRYNADISREAAEILEQRFDMASGMPVDRLAHMRSSMARPTWLVQFHATVPRDFAMWDEERGRWTCNLVFDVLNGRHLIRKAPNPHWDGKAPYVTDAPIVDPHFFWGPSKCEIAFRIQAAINKYVSRGLDFLDLYLDPTWLLDENSGVDPEQLFTGPGNVLLANGEVSEKVLRQITPDLRGFNVSLSEVQILWQWLQQVLGMSADISLGAGEIGSDRQSAHEWVGRENAINLRNRLELLRFEDNALIPLFLAYQRMNRQWLQFPFELSMLGSQAVFDIGTNSFLPPTQTRIEMFEMQPELGLRPLGVMRALSVQARMQNFERLVGVIGPFLPALNIRSFIADILPLYGFYDVANKLNSEEQMRNMMQFIMQSSMGAGGAGAGAGGARPQGRNRAFSGGGLGGNGSSNGGSNGSSQQPQQSPVTN